MTDPINEEVPAPIGQETNDSNLILVRGALLSGLCRFVPVPFLDDYLLARANRHIVASILELHDHSIDINQLKTVYSDTPSCSGTLVFLILLPFKFVFKLLLKLVKTVFFIFTIRAAAMQVGRSIVLGRTVERCLLDGRILSQGDATLAEDAKRLRTALDAAYSGSDWRFMGKMLSGVFRGVKGIRSFGSQISRLLFKGRTESPHPSVENDMNLLPEGDRGKVEWLSQQIFDILSQPETIEYLNELDHRFDEAWEKTQT